MLILLMVISLIVFGISYICSDESALTEMVFGISGIVAFITGIALFVIVTSYPYAVDEKIAMYEEENIKIEEKVKNTVKGYMDYEKDTYTNLVDSSDLETLLIKYPELNSNELVKMEIETYKENSQQLKKLKEEKATKHIKAWWLYFGK